MADSPNTTVLEQEPSQATQPQPEAGALPVDNQFDTAKAHEAAEQFLDAMKAEQEEAATGAPAARDEKGRFIGRGREQSTQPAASAVPTEAPTGVDPVWLDLAKQEGLSDDVISAFKSETEVEAAIQSNRITQAQRAFQTLGVDPNEFAAFVQQKRGGQPVTQPTPTQTQPVTPPIEELKLDLDEDELDPKVVSTIKALTAQVNKLGTVAAENQKLSQKLAELEGQVRQSAESANASRLRAQYAEEWDKAAAKVPGFLDYFPKPSELLRLGELNPRHQAVRDYLGFDAHFQPIWGDYVQRVGDNPTSLYLALRDAWNQSPYSKITGTGKQGTNGTGANGNGSVIRQPARRTGVQEPLPASSNLDAEMKRSQSALGSVWDNMGGNPFRADGP